MGNMIPYGRQSIIDEDIDAVVEILKGDWLTCGPTVEWFEGALCEYTGARHAIAVSNGTAALHVAMLAAGIKAGDRVVTSPNTFLASANCAEYVGATVDFVDIDSSSLNLSPELLEKTWQADSKAVVAVDFAGRPCDMQAIARIARKNGGVVIEDAAHALGSRLEHDSQTYTVGAHPWADMTTLSFHPVKTLTTGEGGAILTDSDELAEKCRLFRNHGMVRSRPEEPWFYEMTEPGFNYRITDLQCALGISQLKRLDDFIVRRQKITDLYNAAFQSLENLQTPGPYPSGSSAWHLYVVQIDFPMLGKNRAQVMQELRELGVGTQVHYIPVHLQPYYRDKYGYAEGKCPAAEAYYEKCLSLPLYPTMSDEMVDLVVKAVRSVAE